MRIILVAMMLLGAAACNPLVRDAKSAVQRQLRDPDSAQFRNVESCGNSGTVRGEVNSRNALGGYVGFSRFVYAHGEVAFFDSNPALYGALSAADCNSA